MLSTIGLVQKGENEQAFDDLDKILADALRDNEADCFKTLCNHAAAMAQAVGDRRRELKYRKQTLPFAKDRQFALYHIAQLLLLDGQKDFARQYASEAYQLSTTDEGQGGVIWPRQSSRRGPTSPRITNWRNIPITLVDPQRGFEHYPLFTLGAHC